MFVDNSSENDWKGADDAMIKFFREVIGRKDLPETLI